MIKDCFGQEITVAEIDKELAQQVDLGLLQSFTRLRAEGPWLLRAEGRDASLADAGQACAYLLGAAVAGRWTVRELRKVDEGLRKPQA